jgi:hypothetical protein
VRPIFVFSGDDHDQCVVLHSSTQPTQSFFAGGGRNKNDNLAREWNTTFYVSTELDHGREEVVRVTHAVERGIAGAKTGPITVDTRWESGSGSRVHEGATPRAGKSVGIPEQTVGTFSFLQGNLRPSFALLSLHSSECSTARDDDQLGDEHGDRESPLHQRRCASHRLEVDVCFLPRQLFIYAWYGALALVSLVALFGFHIYRGCCTDSSAPIAGLPGPSSRSPSSSSRSRSSGCWRRLAVEVIALLAACLSLHLFFVIISA